jgi:hypothetical protein
MTKAETYLAREPPRNPQRPPPLSRPGWAAPFRLRPTKQEPRPGSRGSLADRMGERIWEGDTPSGAPPPGFPISETVLSLGVQPSRLSAPFSRRAGRRFSLRGDRLAEEARDPIGDRRLP